MNSVVSLRLDNEYSADHIARLFPKCKPKVASSSSSSLQHLPLSPSSSSSNGTAVSSSSNGTPISSSSPSGATLAHHTIVYPQHHHHHQYAKDKSISSSKNAITAVDINNEVPQKIMEVGTASTNGHRNVDRYDKNIEPNCNGTSVVGAEDSCSQASSYDMSNDEDSEELATYSSYRLSKSSSINASVSDNHDRRKPSKVLSQYKLKDSRIIEIAGGRELYSQSRSKACRKSRSIDNDKGKSTPRVWELRARMNNEKGSNKTREITETVFGSEIKSVKHSHIRSSTGLNGSVVFDDIGDNWKPESSLSNGNIERNTYHRNRSNLSQSFTEDIKLTPSDESAINSASTLIVPNQITADSDSINNSIHINTNNNKPNVDNTDDNNNNNDSRTSSTTSNHNSDILDKLPSPNVIGNLPIAEYEGSPRRYGHRSMESVMPTLLSSPTACGSRPGFPQQIIENGSTTGALNAATCLPVTAPTTSPATASLATFNYLYEYSETRKVLEEFFKDGDNQEKSHQFQELDYELRRRKRPSYDRGNSYIGLRLSEPTGNSNHCSPRKQSQDSSDSSINNKDQGFMSNYTVSSENLASSVDCQVQPTSTKPPINHRFSLSPEVERKFANYRNFTISPDSTDCDSNFGDGDSDLSSLMLVMEAESNAQASSQSNNDKLLYPSMPILEDGLSSGHESDVEANNPTVLLMKKQITEIEREITERNSRIPNATIATAVTTTTVTTATTSNDGGSQPSYINVPAVSPISSRHMVNSVNGNAKYIENNSIDIIDINSLDPLTNMPDERGPSPPPPAPVPHRDSRHQTSSIVPITTTNNDISNNGGNSNCIEDTIKDIRMTLSRTKTLPLRTSCIVNGDDDKESISSNRSETPVWIPRKKSSISGQSADEDEPDTDLETDRLLGQQRTDDQGFFDDKIEDEESKRKPKNKEGLFHEPSVLIEGVLFRARYLGSTQLVCEGQPTKATRMMQAEEAVSRIKAPDGESQPSTDVDLFISTEKIMVLNTDLKEIMMDHALRTISYIADIGDLVVLMARRRFAPHDIDDPSKLNQPPKMICHVFESDEAQFIAQSIGQAFQVAYVEFLKMNGIEDHSFVKEMDYQEVLNSQEIFGDELKMFAKKELQKEVVVPKMKGEILGVVIVESGWGSMLPTVVIANLAPSGAAARCGQLNIGDQIIAINGVSLVGLPLSTCQNYIKNSKPHTVIKLTVVPCAPVVEVKIRRPDTKYQLGFSVQNGVICSLLRGGIAERGGVRVGHRIIEINNQSVVAVPHEKIVTLLATSIGEILMKTMPTSMFRLLTGQETPAFI